MTIADRVERQLLHLGAVPLRAALGAYGRYAVFGLPGLALIGVALLAGTPWLTTLAVVIGGLGYAALVLWKDQLLAVRPGDPGSAL